MIYKCHHIEKWVNANLDLVEETLEKHSKAVIVIAGASSSGKSYSAKVLQQGIDYSGRKSLIISLDNYNIGISGIIPNKVNENYFDGKLPNMPLIISRIKDIIYHVDFDKKYSPEVLKEIKPAIADLLSKDDLEAFMSYLPREWSKLNFDEPTVYDMKEAAEDIKKLLKGEEIVSKQYSKVVSERLPDSPVIKGSDYDVFIVEGIYALTHYFLDGLKKVDTIKNFIDGNPKSLYLRRIIRDEKTTSADTAFTTRNYFKYIIPSYIDDIYPTCKNADILFNNDMTYSELRSGELFDARLELKTRSKAVFNYLLKNSLTTDVAYQRDEYFTISGENEDNVNILRLREISYDEGKTFVPYNLVHKGTKKVRKDGRVIRPINIIISKDEFPRIWATHAECIDDFYRAGFAVGEVVHKIRYNITYRNQKIKLSQVEGKGYLIDFDEPLNEGIVEEIKKLIEDNEK